MSSFCGCENLRDVKTGSNLKNIDDYAFMNCTSLTSIDVFGKGNKTKLYNIGVSAFANTGLKEVNIMLSGTSTDTQVNDYAFANNLELKKVKTIGSNYLASWEFRGCPSLTDIELANSHSFMGKGVFQDCTGLTNVKIPSNTFMIGEDMFKGCTSLAKVEFQEPGMFDRNKQIGNGFISDTNVTSITFPESVNSLDCLDDFCLMGAKNLKEIHFNGIAGTDLWIGDAQPQQQQPSGGQT